MDLKTQVLNYVLRRGDMSLKYIQTKGFPENNAEKVARILEEHVKSGNLIVSSEVFGQQYGPAPKKITEMPVVTADEINRSEAPKGKRPIATKPPTAPTLERKTKPKPKKRGPKKSPVYGMPVDGLNRKIYTDRIIEKLVTAKCYHKSKIDFADRKHYVKDGTGYIQTANGEYVFCDPEDLNELGLFSWMIRKNGRIAYRTMRKFMPTDEIFGRQMITMGQHLLRCSRDHTVIYLNQNTLDARRGNLSKVKRCVHNRKTSNNTCRYRGVTVTKTGRTIATYRRKCGSEEEAAKLWDKISRFVDGEKAYTNFPNDESEISHDAKS